ncbi:single-stranded DNA-binding protein [Atopobiaceae bacterium HCP3S3_F7]
MSNDTTICIIGNATNAELRFSPAGKAVCNFRLASTPRHFNKQSGQWEDGETLWLNCSLWGQPAENFTETVGDTKGMRVIVTGRLKSRTYEDKEGQRRTVFEVDVDEVGPSLRTQTAIVNRSQRGQATQVPQPQDDPWASRGAPF